MSNEKTLREMQDANHPRATVADLMVITVTAKPGAEATAAEIAAEREAIEKALGAYAAGFVKPTENEPCVCCGSFIGGFFGSFTWNLMHGEGRCSRCGYPVRGIHYVKIDEERGEIRFRMPLQYHPSVLRDTRDEAGESQGGERATP